MHEHHTGAETNVIRLQDSFIFDRIDPQLLCSISVPGPVVGVCALVRMCFQTQVGFRFEGSDVRVVMKGKRNSESSGVGRHRLIVLLFLRH